jgi:hypothetical protein
MVERNRRNKMCRFFSFVGDGHGNFRFSDWEDRQKIGVNADPGPDSHTLILTRLKVPVDKQALWSKYEYAPLIKQFTIDNGVDGHDHEAARNWVEALDFRKVIPALRVKTIIHPFKIKPPKEITKKHLALVKVWASVRASVWDSVGDSVRASVRASVGAYCSSFVECEYEYDFSSEIKLWEMGLVPSYDGKVWRLHGGKDAKVLWIGEFLTGDIDAQNNRRTK